MPWFTVSEERLRYRGRIDRAPFDAWTATPDGKAAVADAAARIGFRLLGRARAARRAMWQALKDAAASGDGATAFTGAADAYARVLSDLAYAPGLPRVHVGLRRLVLVPRALAAGRARPAVAARLLECPAIARLDEPLRAMLCERVILELDAATRAARPDVKQPLRLADWTCIGVDSDFGWVDPVWSGAGWSGHFLVYEWPPTALTRADRKALAQARADLDAGINTLSRERRQQLVDAAARA
jgi:hypothetical protein